STPPRGALRGHDTTLFPCQLGRLRNNGFFSVGYFNPVRASATVGRGRRVCHNFWQLGCREKEGPSSATQRAHCRVARRTSADVAASDCLVQPPRCTGHG